jgi:hypothetical protein
MADALEMGFIVVRDEELMLPLRKLTEINPDATAGNLISGQDYDPDDFDLTLTIGYCPFCGGQFKPTPTDNELEDVWDGSNG